MAKMEIIRHRISICGHVRDAVTGRGISGALVELARRNVATRTRADGSYWFQDLRAGQYELRVSAPHLLGRYGSAAVTNLPVAYDSADRPVLNSRAEVSLPPTRIAGKVSDAASAAAIVGATARIRGGDIEAKTGADGRYLLAPLQPGAPTLEILARGYATATRKLSLAPGQELSADVALSKT
jgi:Carboxypeptidase regulatory-like domain